MGCFPGLRSLCPMGSKFLCHVRDLSVLPALTSAPASPWDEGSWVLAPSLGGDVCQVGFVPLP